MTLTTPCVGIPYPERSDPPDVQADMLAMATRIDALICGANGLPLGAIFAWYDMGGALPGGVVRCDGTAFSGFPELETYLGTNIAPDLLGKFLRGADGGQDSGGGGGQDEAYLLNHTHTIDQHRHSMTHTHGMTHTHSIAHNHPRTRTIPPNTVDVPASGADAMSYAESGEINYGTISSNYTVGSGLSWGSLPDLDLPPYSGNSGASTKANTDGSSSSNTGYASQSTNSAGDGTSNVGNRPPYMNVTYLIVAESKAS